MQSTEIKKKVVKKSSSKKKKRVRTGSDKLNYLYNLESKSISTFSRLAALFSHRVLNSTIHTVTANAFDAARTVSRERNHPNGARKVLAATTQRSLSNSTTQHTGTKKATKKASKKIAKKSSAKKAAPKKATKKVAPKKAAKKA